MRALDGPPLYVWLLVLTGMTVLFCAAYMPDVPLFRAVGLFFFRSVTMLRIVFILATAAHFGEAIYAWQLAKRVDPVNAKGWFWQTFALGYFSLRFLLKKRAKP